ncbi:MAG: hypothetical protein AAGF73_01280 [Actinomycetota bacterium]
MRTFAALIIVAAVAAGCSDSDDGGSDSDDDGSATTAPVAAASVPDDGSPEERADAYAQALSDGETTGCASTPPGAESEVNPGCIYSAAYTGCLEGITGEQVGTQTAEEAWVSEPALLALQNQAVIDCTG